MSVSQCLTTLASTMSRAITAIRQRPHNGIRALCVQMNTQYDVLSSALETRGPSSSQHSHGLRLANLSEELIQCVHENRTLLPQEVSVKVLLVPIKFLCEQIFPNIPTLAHGGEALFLKITDTMNWVQPDVNGSETLRQLLADTAANMIDGLNKCSREDLLRISDNNPPSLFMERCFLLMCRRPPILIPREIDILWLHLSAASALVGACARVKNFQRGLWLISPGVMHFCKRILRASMESSLKAGWTTNLLNLLTSALHAAAAATRRAEANPAHVHVHVHAHDIATSDEAHLDDLRRCSAQDESRTLLTCGLSAAIMNAWPSSPEGVPEGAPDQGQLAGTRSALRTLFQHSFRTQIRLRTDGRRKVVHVDDAGHCPSDAAILDILEAVVRISAHFINNRVRPPRLVRFLRESGNIVATETLVRGMKQQQSLHFQTARVINTILTLIEMMLIDPCDASDRLGPCISIAATARKLVVVEPCDVAERASTRLICTQLSGKLLDWPLATRSLAVVQLMTIISAILTDTYNGQLRSECMCQMVGDIRTGATFKAVMRGLLLGCSSSRVPDRAAQGRVWTRFAATLSRRVLPGCCNWLCTNYEEACESAMLTLLCSGCRRARYCSERCQREAWLGGHKDECKRHHGGIVMSTVHGREC